MSSLCLFIGNLHLHPHIYLGLLNSYTFNCPLDLSIRMSSGHLKPNVSSMELLIFLPSSALCTISLVWSWWQLHPGSSPSPQNHVFLLLSLLEGPIQSLNESCWLHLQAISELWHLLPHLLLPSWPQTPSLLIWIIAVNSNWSPGCFSSSVVCSQNCGQRLSNRKSADATPPLLRFHWK